MNRRDDLMQILCGAALIVLCVIYTAVSMTSVDGDITPVFVLFPMGVYAIMSNKTAASKSEN